jgi:hypothetical protein
MTPNLHSHGRSGLTTSIVSAHWQPSEEEEEDDEGQEEDPESISDAESTDGDRYGDDGSLYRRTNDSDPRVDPIAPRDSNEQPPPR